MAQMTSNDEQAVELTDKIAAMEEELRKVCVCMYAYLLVVFGWQLAPLSRSRSPPGDGAV